MSAVASTSDTQGSCLFVIFPLREVVFLLLLISRPRLKCGSWAPFWLQPELRSHGAPSGCSVVSVDPVRLAAATSGYWVSAGSHVIQDKPQHKLHDWSNVFRRTLWNIYRHILNSSLTRLGHFLLVFSVCKFTPSPCDLCCHAAFKFQKNVSNAHPLWREKPSAVLSLDCMGSFTLNQIWDTG